MMSTCLPFDTILLLLLACFAGAQAAVLSPRQSSSASPSITGFTSPAQNGGQMLTIVNGTYPPVSLSAPVMVLPTGR